MKSPINSTKHYVQMSLATVAAAAVTNTELVDAIALASVGAGAEECRSGCVIKAIYIELWVRGQDTSPGAFQVALTKVDGGGSNPTFANMGNMMDFEGKKQVFYFSQGLSNVSGADAVPVFRGWLKIPKGKQRFGLRDKFIVSVAALALDVNFCGFATYKEYY